MLLSNSKGIPFYKSVRFKLTMFYSGLLFLLSLLFVIGINISLNNYFESMPPKPMGMGGRYNVQNPDFVEENREILREIRLADLRELQKRSVLGLIPLALLSFSAGWILSGYFLRPVNRLQTHFDSIDKNELGHQVTVTSDDEFGALTQSFNSLSMRLKKSFDLQTRFIQDASHEIKTPLTIIKTNLEVISEDNKIRKDPQLIQIMSDVVGSVDRLKDLTNQLLDLSNNKELTKEKTDYADFIKATITSVIELAKVEKVSVKFDFDKIKKVFVEIDKQLFHSAISNIVNNASKYGRSGDGKLKLTVKLEAKNGSAVLSIFDKGAGFPDQTINNIFDRFYTVDNSRSRTKTGYGLGLAIVQQIVEAHGGEITANNVIPTGAEFKIKIATLKYEKK